MTKKDYLVRSFINAAGVLIYVSVLALVLFNGQNIFGNAKTFLVPVFMLLLFIVSALITGSLVLGKPILLYLEGLKKEALVLLFSTLSWLVLFLFVVVVVLLMK